MMDIGSRVRVTDGQYHGKTGEIVAVSMICADSDLKVVPVVLLKGQTEPVEIEGSLLTLIR